MPRELATLEKLGLRDIPRWFREKYNIPSLIPSGHGHPRAQGSHGQHWKEDTPERAGMKSIQYSPQLDLNGSVDASDVEKGSKQKSPGGTGSQQSPAVIQGPSRSSFSTNNSPKVASHPKQPGRYGGQFGSAVKRHDLLSFDPLPEYPSLNAIGPGIGALNYSATRDEAEALDRMQHEELLRSMQALMPNSEFLPTPFDVTPGASGQNRSKRVQKSRRLYQPRPQATGPEASRFDNPDYDSFKSVNTLTATSSNVGPSFTKDSAGPPAGPVTEPPTRGASPSVHSGSSGSDLSPRVIQPQGSDKDNNSLPSPIGSKRVQQKKPMGSTNDFFKLNSGHGK